MMHVRAILIAALLLLVDCSAGPKDAQPPNGGARLPESTGGAVPPVEAFALLAKSATDSCAVCARELKEDAFHILDDAFRPGRIVRSDGSRRFLRGTGGANEFILSSWQHSDPRFSFRFHTLGERLIGIAEEDLTKASIADRFRSISEEAVFDGAIEVIPFAYGDGAAYLYFPSSKHLQVHCRIIEIKVE
jgi:hypothetical protein